MTTFQGLINDEIVLPQSAADHGDPEQLVLAARCLGRCADGAGASSCPASSRRKRCGAITRATISCRRAAGGHAQYYTNRGSDEIAIRCAGAGLKSMLADPHLELFNLLVRLKRREAFGGAQDRGGSGYRSPTAALKDLDKKLRRTGGERAADAAAQDVAEEPAQSEARAGRRDERAFAARCANQSAVSASQDGSRSRARRATAQPRPSFRAVKALCDMAGLTITGFRTMGFAPMRTVWPDGPDVRGFVFRADTDKGPRAALFYREGSLFKRHLSVLVVQGGGLPIGSQSLTKADYAAIVPKDG